MKIVLSEYIRAPKAEVYKVFTNFQKFPSWLEQVHHIDFFEGMAQPIVGMRMKESRGKNGITASEELCLSRVEAPHLLEISSRSRGILYKKRYRFNDENGLTKVTLALQAYPKSRAKKFRTLLRGLLLKRSIVQSLRQDLADFKNIAENPQV